MNKCNSIGHLRDAPTPQLTLLAGQLYHGNKVEHLRTLLGSCVSVVLWNPKQRMGGMCHYLLPGRVRAPGSPRDGRYGDEAMEMLVESIHASGGRPQDYAAHLYGGADTLPAGGGVKFNVGERNIERGWSLIDQYGFNLVNVDVGDRVPRNVALRLSDGQVEMRRGTAMKGNLP